MNAYRNDPALKVELLQAVAADLPFPLTAPGATTSELTDWADEVGLPQAFILLAAHLDRGAAQEDGSFVHDILHAIRPGAALDKVAHLWVAWGWSGASEPLGAIMSEAPFHGTGKELIRLHEQAAEGLPVDRLTWRAMRSRLNQLGEQDGDAALAATILAASAWDFASVPGAAADTANAWEKMLMARIRRANGWTKVEDAEVQQLIVAQRDLAETKIGPAPAGHVRDEAYRRRITEELLSGLNELEAPILHRNAEMQRQIGDAFKVFREEARAAFLTLTEKVAAEA